MKNLIGQRFGNIVVLKDTGKRAKNGQVFWECLCDCGRITIVMSGHLLSNHTKSCGCLRKNRGPIKHGLINTKIYNAYNHMKDRCYNRRNDSYKNYGGRGIKICDEWLSNFMNFYNWSMKNGYREDLTIDRINNNGNYEPNNCRWVDMQTQLRNTRRNRIYQGKCFSEWSEIVGISRGAFFKRVRKYGIEKAINFKK